MKRNVIHLLLIVQKKNHEWTRRSLEAGERLHNTKCSGRRYWEVGKTYPNMRSIHSCKWADTYSLSRAILCLCTKSTGFSAQAGSLTESGNAEVNNKRVTIYVWNAFWKNYPWKTLMSIPSFSPNCVVPKSIEFSFVRTSGR